MPVSLSHEVNPFTGRPFTVVAHRGASGHAPENTMPAFERAVEMGAHAIELDVQLSADGEVMVIHDPVVDRVTGASGSVRALRRNDLEQLDAGYRFPGRDSSYPFRGRGVGIPTLSEVFETFPDMPLIVEMKPQSGAAIVPAVVREIERHGAHRRVTVGSFSSGFLRKFRTLLPTVPTGFGQSEVRNFFLLNLCHLQRLYDPGADVLLVPERTAQVRLVTPRLLKAAEAMDLEVHVWTIEEADGMRRLLELGVDGIMTGYPDRLFDVLAQAEAEDRR